MKWEEGYQMGVETIDIQHKQLFSVARQIYKLFQDGNSEKKKFACQEGMKFLKSHLVKHYADEEAYMQQVNYANYIEHKRLHDNMTNNMLPVLDRELQETDYAEEVIQKFIGLCIGWLISHIAREDMAIVGKNVSRLGKAKMEQNTAMLEEVIADIFRINFSMDLEPRIVNDNYFGEYFGKAVYHEIKYDYILEKRKTFVRIGIEEKLLFGVCRQFLDSELTEIDETILGMVEMLSKVFMDRIGEAFQSNHNKYAYKDCTFLSREQFYETMKRKIPDISLLLDTKLGMFTLCVDNFVK